MMNYTTDNEEHKMKNKKQIQIEIEAYEWS